MAPTKTTVGQLLVHAALPEDYRPVGVATNKNLKASLIELARSDPARYVGVVSKLKKMGDAVATDSGITVGLDDIEPEYAARDAILEPALAQIKRTKDPKKRLDIINGIENKLLQLSGNHPGQMGPMARSGARGNISQLMKTVTSPIAAVNDKEETIPWLISKSYAEGLKPADNWIAIGESRRNAVESFINVSVPGELSKILVNNMSDQLITMPDCGTHNGISMNSGDSNIQDRYLAQTADGVPANTLITPSVANTLRGKASRIVVRSPMTCVAPDGVCQKCYGLATKGRAPTLGTNVGMISAQAMGEPLTQLALSAKHSVRTTAQNKAVLDGLQGFKQLTEIPQSFFNKATLATQGGSVTKIVKAPQGGHYVYVHKEEHYVPPNLEVLVKPGAHVEAGDILSDGIPKPDEVVQYKGLGVGRQYLVDQLHGIYTRRGIDLDRRHLELLAKTDLNYVKMTDHDSEDHGFMRGDVVDYNRFRVAIAENAKVTPLKSAVGGVLGDNALHFTAGTTVTPAVAATLKEHGIEHVPIVTNMPKYEPVMKPLSRTPLLHPDWMARLGHRNLKTTILEGAAFGETSDIHGVHPVPGFAFGSEFGQGLKGRY
jgi:hypothetical protein